MTITYPSSQPQQASEQQVTSSRRKQQHSLENRRLVRSPIPSDFQQSPSIQIGNPLPDTYDSKLPTPSLTSPPIPQIFSDHYLPLNSSEQAKQRPTRPLTQDQRQGTYSISRGASATPNLTPRRCRDESYCKHEDCTDSALDFRSLSVNKCCGAPHRSETSKIQLVKAYSPISGTEVVEREYWARTPQETLGSELASISQRRANPRDRREGTDGSGCNNHSLSGSDGSARRNQDWRRELKSVANESVDDVSSPAPGEVDYVQQSQISTQSTQESCQFGVTYPYEDDWAYIPED